MRIEVGGFIVEVEEGDSVLVSYDNYGQLELGVYRNDTVVQRVTTWWGYTKENNYKYAFEVHDTLGINTRKRVDGKEV